MIDVFLPLEMPRTTSQQNVRVATNQHTGKAMVFKSRKLAKGFQLFRIMAKQKRPRQPYSGSALSLRLVVTWPWTKEDLSTVAKRASAAAEGRTWCTTKPDCDNFAKQVQDILAESGWLCRDEEIADLHVQKLKGTPVGIRIVLDYAREVPL